MPRATFRNAIVGLVVVGAVTTGGILWFRGRGPEVTTVAPRSGEVVQTLVALGRIAPPSEVEFTAREPTEIVQAPVEEGQHVAAGELLVQMDHAEADAIVTQAEASLEQARAQAREVRTLTKPSAAAALKEANANLEEAERQFTQDEDLFRSGTLTAAEVDQSRTALTIAQNRARSAKLQAAAVSTSGAQWQAAIAAETFAEAGLIAARARRDRLAVRAPAAGTLIAREIDPGDVVQIGATLGRLALDGPTRLVIEPDERNLRLLAVGQKAVASAEAFPDDRFDAVVEFLAPAVDPVRGTIEVRLAVESPPEYLRTDMTVSVEIEVERSDAAIALEASAVHDLASEHPWVFVVEGGRARRRDVTIGLRGDAVVEIVDGLSSSDTVVGGDAVDLSDGDRVRVATP